MKRYFSRAFRTLAAAVSSVLLVALATAPEAAAESGPGEPPAPGSNGWEIRGNVNDPAAQWAGGCAGEFWEPTVDLGVLHYGGKQICSQPVDQSLNFTLQRCNQALGICLYYSDVDATSKHGVNWSMFADNYVRCDSTEENTYRIKVTASAHGSTANALSNEIEKPCYINDL